MGTNFYIGDPNHRNRVVIAVAEQVNQKVNKESRINDPNMAITILVEELGRPIHTNAN